MNTTLRLAAAAVALASHGAWAAFWDVEPVYTGGFASGDASLAISSANVPSISYSAVGGLYVATRGAGEWESEFVAPVGYAGGWSSMAFDAAGQLCAAYVDSSEGFTSVVRYAFRSAGSWRMETIEDVGWLPDYVSLARDPAGRMCAAYCQTVGEQVCMRFARRVGPGVWEKQTAAAVGSVTGPSLAINAAGTSFVAFVDSSSGKLKVAVRPADGGWSVEEVDGGSSAPAVWYPWITVDANGEAAAAYFIGSAGQTRLRFARRQSGSWHAETAATLTGCAACYCSAAVTPGGVPLIAYRDPASERLKHAWKSGGVWHVETIDLAEGSGVRPCLALDSVGSVHAAYVDGVQGAVRFAWALFPRSISEAGAMPDGETVQISGVMASTGAGDLASTVYVQEVDRSSGIRLRFTDAVVPVVRGMILDVQGRMATVDGEREIVDPLLAELALISGQDPPGDRGR